MRQGVVTDLGPLLLADFARERAHRQASGHLSRTEDEAGAFNPGYRCSTLRTGCGPRWQVPAYTLPDNVSDIAVQRILVRQGVTTDLGSLLLADFRWAIEHFDKHPVNVSMTEAEAGGFNHG